MATAIGIYYENSNIYSVLQEVCLNSTYIADSVIELFCTYS